MQLLKANCCLGDDIMGAKTTQRTEKGNSIINFPSEYTVIDIETTGRSPQYDSIIEVSAIKVANNKQVDHFDSLIKPNVKGPFYVDSFIEELTGITNEMLSKADGIDKVLPKYADFIGNSIVVGHNVNFDINFLYDNFLEILGTPFKNDFIDTMRIYKKINPEAKHHRLKDLCGEYGIENINAHRSYSDCEATMAGFVKLRDTVKSKFENYDDFTKLFSKRSGGNGYRINPKDIIGEPNKADKDSPLYGKYCVFTGKLENFVRTDAWQIVANLGGVPEERVTKKTNFLILGNNDYCKSIKDGKSNKQKKAEKYKLEGQDIEILPEIVFYDMIGGEY